MMAFMISPLGWIKSMRPVSGQLATLDGEDQEFSVPNGLNHFKRRGDVASCHDRQDAQSNTEESLNAKNC